MQINILTNINPTFNIRYETSAALGYGIDDAAVFLLSKILEDVKPAKGDEDGNTVNIRRQQRPKDSGCSC